ncbi:MAG: HD domain-containing protein [Bacilli bacterium]|nr:HD domain-containing protein [Bacilli bacterium]
MMHSLEVAEITRKICEKLSDALKDKGIEINPEKAYIGALLHDVGHTPFGHAGERTLHEILTGKVTCSKRLKVVKQYKIEQGFKHNVNSGYLYVLKFMKSADEVILDCIVKHTKTAYEEDDGLDYGINLIEKRSEVPSTVLSSKEPVFWKVISSQTQMK